jgi:hypothetical protein
MRVAVLIIAAILAGAAGLAQAQGVRGPLFVSPMGEPFRSAEGAAPILVWFAAADADHDGKLDRAEFLAQARTFFSVLDANHDGAATSFESTGLYRAQAPEVLSTRMAPLPQPRPPRSGLAGAQNAPRRGPSPIEMRSGAALYGLLDAVEPVMSCDADLSRRVTLEEFEACAARRFALLDTDGDGLFALADSERAMAFAEAHD